MTTHSTPPLGGYGEPTSTLVTRAGAARLIPVQFSARRLVRFLWVGTALVVLLGIGSRLAGAVKTDFPGRDLFAQMFALNSEANVPTLFSCLLLSTAAAVAWMIAQGKRQQADRCCAYPSCLATFTHPARQPGRAAEILKTTPAFQRGSESRGTSPDNFLKGSLENSFTSIMYCQSML